MQYVFVTYESMMYMCFNACLSIHQYIMYYLENKLYDEFYFYKSYFDQYALYYNLYRSYVDAIE